MNSDPSKDPGPVPVEAIEAAAAAWLSLRDRGMTMEETAAFMHWLQQEPRHAEIFAELDRTWTEFNKLSVVPAASSAAPDPDLLAPRIRPRRRTRAVGWMGGLGAAAALTVAWFMFDRPSEPHYAARTQVGSPEQLALPDGSIAHLNTNSALEASFTVDRREVRLTAGESFFQVTPDPARPFSVHAGPVLIQAVGTAFNVRQRPNAIEVFVTEGRVRVVDSRHGGNLLAATEPSPSLEPRLLQSGERAVLPLTRNAGGLTPLPSSVEKMTEVDVRRALAWQDRRLEFDRVPLAEVVAEFNRYNRRQVVIADPQLAEKRFSGTFLTDGVDAFVALLENDFGVAVERGERDLVLRLRR